MIFYKFTHVYWSINQKSLKILIEYFPNKSSFKSQIMYGKEKKKFKDLYTVIKQFYISNTIINIILISMTIGHYILHLSLSSS